MKQIERTLCIAALVAFAATAAPAQTCLVAEMISPTPGSTLPAGAVTFEWCNANADYFLTVESIPGAHDIFFAFAGGVGPGAGVVSVTLGSACAPTIPTGCIPTNGETIFVTLWTLKHGTVVPPSPFNYTYIAANTPPAPFPCTADQNTLCLSSDRFRVTASWRSATDFGVAHAVGLTGDTGYFWFFDSGNVEAIAKVLNACAINSRFWVFVSGLTNVEVTLIVTDTQNGITRTYLNPINVAFQPVQDTAAFATCL